MKFELKADPALLREMRHQTRAMWAIVSVLRALATNRNATSVVFGPLQIIDKPKE